MTTTTPIELRKIAYRQSAKDGLVITFAVHPNDMPANLAAAAIGTRFAAALVEIGDDEKPVKKNWREMTPTQQAGILCADRHFQLFLAHDLHIDANLMHENTARDEVCKRCGVTSRAELSNSNEPARVWAALVSDFRAWQHEPEYIEP